MPAQNIPNTDQRTMRARMKVRSFTSLEKPNLQQLQAFDKEVNNFLNTIDNTKRFLNGRNSYSIGDKIYVLIWYLEKMTDKPATTPFGDKVIPGQPIIKTTKEDVRIKQNNSSEEKTA